MTSTYKPNKIILTSYFGNLANVLNPISVSLSKPKWYSGPEYKKLAPTWLILNSYRNGLINDQQYAEQYVKEILSKLDPNEIVRELIELYPESDVVTILCYETPNKFCHRQIISDWINENTSHVSHELPTALTE